MASAADLPADLVEDIFLRLDDTADLVRASAACAAFRRVVSDGRFLRRFRSLHRRPVLGLFSRRSRASGGGLCFHPAAPPRRGAQAARAAASFSSSFLPADPTTTTELGWHLHDARDCRVLLSPAGDATTCLSSFSYLVIYDPLHHKHVQIPNIPNDIVLSCACSWQRSCRCDYNYICDCDRVYCECMCEYDPFLVPAATADDDDDLSSFRVMCTVLSCTNMLPVWASELGYDFELEAFVYSSATGKWRGVASLDEADYDRLQELSSMERHYAHGCFYWVPSCEKHMLVLDMNDIETGFGVVRLPPGTGHEDKVIVQAATADDEEDRIGLLSLCGDTLDLYAKAPFAGGANDCWQWRHDAVITLPDDYSYQWSFGGAADQGYALLRGVLQEELMNPKINAQYFTVELQTLVVEQLCDVEFDTKHAFLFASFPPPFAPPSL